MAKLNPDTIRDIFRKVVELRGAGKSYKNRVLDKVRRTEEIEHMQKLAGLTEAPFRTAKDIAGNVRRKFSKFSDRGELTVDDVYDKWEEIGRPDSLQEIVRMLQGLNFTDGEIDKAFKMAGVTDAEGEDEKITKLANGIKKAGLQGQVLKYLDSINESVQVNEAPVTNKSIKDAFVKIADSLPAPEQEEEPEEEPEEEQGTLVASVDMSNQDALNELFANALNLVESEQFGRKRKT